MTDERAGSSLKDHQHALLVLLKEFDSQCKKLNIPYILFAGTMLGAVRHQGFIPWDDDLDVLMLRADYERFMNQVPQYLDTNRFFLQREFSQHWPMFFSKLRLENTAAIEKYHVRDEKMHQGIYIDIFPCDNLSDSKVIRRLQFAASKIVISQGLYMRGYETESRGKKIFMQLCRLLPRSPFLAITQWRCGRKTKMVHSFLGACSHYEKGIFQREWITESEAAVFEDGQYPISAHAEALLTTLYGDYMEIPPPEKRRCKVHAVIVDVNHPYTDYLQMQREMEITEYSRSIR